MPPFVFVAGFGFNRVLQMDFDFVSVSILWSYEAIVWFLFDGRS